MLTKFDYLAKLAAHVISGARGESVKVLI